MTFVREMQQCRQSTDQANVPQQFVTDTHVQMRERASGTEVRRLFGRVGVLGGVCPGSRDTCQGDTCPEASVRGVCLDTLPADGQLRTERCNKVGRALKIGCSLL